MNCPHAQLESGWRLNLFCGLCRVQVLAVVIHGFPLSSSNSTTSARSDTNAQWLRTRSLMSNLPAARASTWSSWSNVPANVECGPRPTLHLQRNLPVPSLGERHLAALRTSASSLSSFSIGTAASGAASRTLAVDDGSQLDPMPHPVFLECEKHSKVPPGWRTLLPCRV